MERILTVRVAATLLALTSCGALPTASTLHIPSEDRAATGASGPVRLLRTPEGDAVSLRDAARDLAGADVVFLGEQHDSSDGHAVQLALTRALAQERGEIILSLEMFERDAQPRLDLYLAGTIDEETFLAGARPWPNYAEHYRAAVEFAKERGFEVVAANCYRPIAARVARRGLGAGLGDAWAARHVDVSDGEYRRRFNDVMGHTHDIPEERSDRIFAAQCIKDATMAESIAKAIERRGEDAPLVVHWNGRFHSDYGLGTVERLKLRMPALDLAVVSMLATDNLGRELTEDEQNQGHYVIVTRPQ